MWFSRFRKKTKIADLVPGNISIIKGTIKATRKLTLPPSGTSCVFYSLFQEKYGKGARGSGRALWFPEKMESKTVTFNIVDESGEISIQDSGEHFTVSGAHQEAGMIRGKGKRRYSASYLIPGDVVLIRGLVEKIQGNNGLALTAPPNKRLQVETVQKSEE